MACDEAWGIRAAANGRGDSVMQQTATTAKVFGSLGPAALAAMLWLALVAFNLVAQHDAIAAMRFPDADDEMRLAQVRDLIAGQPWFDIMQYRVDPQGGGGLMHWSRFIDAPLAGLILLLQPLLGDAAGERWAVALYPQLLILPLFLLFGRILSALGDRLLVASGLLIAFTSATFLQYFVPMRIDHHGWQLLLSVAMVSIALRPASLANGLVAAAVITIHVEISLEGLPYLAIFGGLFAVDWLRDPQTGRRLLGFVLGLLGFPAIWLLAMRGAVSTFTVYCDAFSLPYGAAVAACGLVLAAWLLGPNGLSRSRLRRFLALVIAAIAGGLAFVLSGPQCLGGPFGALDPLVRHHWYEWVSEGRPIWSHANTYGVVYFVPTLVGLAALAFAWRQSRNGPFAENWTRLAAIAIGSAAMSAFVTRMGATTHAFLLPGFAAMALALWRWSRGRSSSLGRVGSALLVLAALPAVFAAIGVQLARPLIGQSPPTRSEASDCPSAVGAAALAREPLAHLFAPIDIGPALLVRTPHSVVATGHHRNEMAMRRVISAFLAEPAEAEAIVRAESAQYLVICRGFTKWSASLPRRPADWRQSLLVVSLWNGCGATPASHRVRSKSIAYCLHLAARRRSREQEVVVSYRLINHFLARGAPVRAQSVCGGIFSDRRPYFEKPSDQRRRRHHWRRAGRVDRGLSADPTGLQGDGDREGSGLCRRDQPDGRA